MITDLQYDTTFTSGKHTLSLHIKIPTNQYGNSADEGRAGLMALDQLRPFNQPSETDKILFLTPAESLPA